MKNKQMVLRAHFLELRKRFIICVLSITILSFGAYFFRTALLDFLIHPLSVAMQQENSTKRLIYTGLAEGFIISFKISLLSGFVLSLPIIGYQLYKFILPALFPHERRALGMFIIGMPILFLLGCVFAYFIVLPITYAFFLDYQTSTTLIPIQLEAKISEYISLTIHLLTAFGLAFEMPLVLILLGNIGVITEKTLVSYRRIMVVFIFVIAAVLTPPDVISQLALAIPLLLLYELSIILLKRKKNYARYKMDTGKSRFI